MPSKPKPDKSSKVTPTANPKEELEKKLREVFPTVVGEFSDRLAEKEALEVAIETVKSLQGDWEARLFEIHTDGE